VIEGVFIDADHESEIKKWGHRLCATAILKRVFSQEISTVFCAKFGGNVSKIDDKKNSGREFIFIFKYVKGLVEFFEIG
jgi:hypothetical protein